VSDRGVGGGEGGREGKCVEQLGLRADRGLTTHTTPEPRSREKHPGEKKRAAETGWNRWAKAKIHFPIHIPRRVRGVEDVEPRLSRK